MVRVNTKKLQLATGVLPVMLSVSFLLNHSWLVLLVSILSLFIIVGVVPMFKRRENIYMFILSGIAALPINIRLVYMLVSSGFFSLGSFITDLILGAVVFFVLFSVEEVVMGVITRLIFKRQYKVKMM